MNNKFRKVDLIDSEAFKEAFLLATSYSKLLRLLGLGVSSTTVGHARERATRDGLDDSHFIFARDPGKKYGPVKLVLDEDLERRVSSCTLRASLFKAGVEYCCKNCGNPGIWHGRQLTLEVHHKNSNWRDNRLENLEFLCPNCHSQHTRNNKEVDCSPRFPKCECGNDIVNPESNYCSLTCHGSKRVIIDWNSIDLVAMIDEEGRTCGEVAKLLDIRYNTVKKWYLRQKNAATPPA